MPLQTTDQLKQWFQTADKPTQQQFYDWLDSFIHKSEGITIPDVAGLQAALDDKADQVQLELLISILYPYKIVLLADGEYDVPVGLEAYHIKIKPAEFSDAIYAGITDGGNEIIPVTEDGLTAGEWAGFDCSIVADGLSKRIYFKGIVASTQILIYRRTLTHSNI